MTLPKPNQVHEVLDPPSVVLAREDHLQVNISFQRKMLKEIAGLPQEADVTRPKLRPQRLRSARQPLAHQLDMAAVGFVQSGEAGEKRGLPASGRPHDGDQLAGPHPQAHPAQRQGFVFAEVKKAIELKCFKDVHVNSSETTVR